MNYILTNLISSLILPPGCFLVVLAVVIGFNLSGKSYSYRQENHSLVTGLLIGLFVLIYLLSSYPGSWLLLTPLESAYSPVQESELATTKQTAIVVLGGGINRTAATGDTIGKTTLKRLYHGWQLEQKTGSKLAVSGGVPPGIDGLPAAKVMESVLLDWGMEIEQIITESEALNTWLNAVKTTDILEKRGYEKIILVTSAAHMERAVYSFSQHWSGDLVAAPTDYILTSEISILSFLPHRSALDGSLRALHEWVGLVWYHLKSWI